MRTVFRIVFLFLLTALATCYSPQREARQMARRAERLFDTMPDSTFKLIDSILRMPVYFNEKHRMDMALLQGEALFGDRGQEIPPLMDDEFFDDKPFLSTSPELERAADYYARKKQYAKAAHAALYSGFIQQHYNEKQAAMQSFKDAERYGEMVNDSLTVARAEYWMGRMLYDDGLKQEALDAFKKSDMNFGLHYIDKGKVLNGMACCYLLRRQYDSTKLSLEQALAYADEDHSNKLRHKILNNYAVLYRLQGMFALALDNLHLIEKEMDSAEMPFLYLNKANVFVAMSNVDSAAHYYDKLKPILLLSEVKELTKASAYDALSRFAKNVGNDSLALYYREAHEQLLYKILQLRQEQNIYHVQRQYDYENLQNALNRKIVFWHRIILIISILLFASTVIILILQLRHKQMREAEAEMKRQIDNLKSDLQKSVKTPYLEQELSGHLRTIMLACRTKKNAYDPKNEWNPLVLRVTNGRGMAFEAIVEEMEKVYPNLYTVLRQKYPELNETETKVCLLSCSDLSNAEMAEILEISKHTVDKNRSKLRDKLNLTPEKMKEQLHKALSN